MIFNLTLVANHNLRPNLSFLTLRFNLYSHNKLSSNLSLQSQSMTLLHYLCLHKLKSQKSRKNTIQRRSCQAQMLGRWAETLSTYPLEKRLNNLKTIHHSRRRFTWPASPKMWVSNRWFNSQASIRFDKCSNSRCRVNLDSLNSTRRRSQAQILASLSLKRRINRTKEDRPFPFCESEGMIK